MKNGKISVEYQLVEGQKQGIETIYYPNAEGIKLELSWLQDTL